MVPRILILTTATATAIAALAVPATIAATPAKGTSGFRCWTQLAGPLCPTCRGSELSAHFEGTGPKRRWVRTGSGGFWEQEPLQNGHAVLVASATTRTHGIR
jgi:hypothetical protein